MTQQTKKQSNLLTLVAPAFQEQSYNMAFVDSMLNQTQQEGWEAICIHNGEPKQDSPFLIKKNELETNKQDEKVVMYWSQQNTGNYGCDNRQYEIHDCNTEYILQSSIQDYWLPQAMQFILSTLGEHKPDILIFDSINHIVGPCQQLHSSLEWGKVDWGNFCIRTDIAKKVGIKHGDQYCADWFFIKDVLESGLVDPNKIIKLPYILTVHN